MNATYGNVFIGNICMYMQQFSEEQHQTPECDLILVFSCCARAIYQWDYTLVKLEVISANLKNGWNCFNGV